MKRVICLSILMLTGILAYSQDQFWGVTYLGGQYGKGVIFKTDANGGSLAVVHSFNDAANGPHYPAGALVKALNGKLYGITVFGGANDKGTIIEFDPATPTLVKKKDLSSIGVTGVYGTLCQASNGKLYGVAEGEPFGSSQMGSLFEYDLASNTLTKIYDFTSETTGNKPEATLIEGAAGKLYGTTLFGGTAGSGTLFQKALP